MTNDRLPTGERFRMRAAFWGVAFLAAAAGGCGQPPDAGEDVGTVTSGLTSVDFSDGSGTVKVRIKTCDWAPAGLVNCAYCAVDSGWVRIGGGAEIENNAPSARLKASLPSNDPSPTSGCTGNGSGGTRSTWIARSTATGTTTHRLRAYVIGLQLTGLSATALESNVFVHEDTGDVGPLLSTETVPTLMDSVLIGGGAEIVPPAGYSATLPAGGNGYLTESRPLDTNEWKGSAIFTSPSDGAIKVYSIGIAYCPTGWDECIFPKLRSKTTGPNTGYGTSDLATPYPWVTTSVGGLGVTNGSSSRYLADLIPFSGSAQGFTVRTKDQGTTVNGTTTGYSLNIMRGGWGLWGFNSIRFNTAGTALYRPSGTAPVNLQQSSAFPDTPAHQWHMESFGSAGQYRIRNGNPQQGTQCAYRQSGNSTVRVGTCGSGNEFRWTVVGDLNGTFKLRNVAAGQCLDNNNQGSTTSNVVLKTCASGYSTVQSFFLDAFSWPL